MHQHGSPHGIMLFDLVGIVTPQVGIEIVLPVRALHPRVVSLEVTECCLRKETGFYEGFPRVRLQHLVGDHRCVFL